jgi:hypothetical protein
LLRGHFPVLAGCQNRDFCPPKFVGGGGGATELFLENCRLPRVFRPEALYRRRGVVRSGARRPHPMAARPGPWPREPGMWGPGGPLPTLLWISGSFRVK